MSPDPFDLARFVAAQADSYAAALAAGRDEAAVVRDALRGRCGGGVAVPPASGQVLQRKAGRPDTPAGRGPGYFLTKIAFGIMPWMPLTPSTTCVTRKSTATLDSR